MTFEEAHLQIYLLNQMARCRSCQLKIRYFRLHTRTVEQSFRSSPSLMLRSAGASLALGKTMYQQGIIGHVGIDFVTFFDAYSDAQRLWAVDLNIGVTRSQSSFMLFNFLLGGRLVGSKGEYMVPPFSKTNSGKSRRSDVKSDASSAMAGLELVLVKILAR